MTNRGPRTNRRRELAELAGQLGGIFTAAAARDLGLGSGALAHHTRMGTVERVGRGVYRLAGFPPSENDRLVAVAAALGDGAVASHETALKLYGVSDVAPSRLHFTMPRGRRYVSNPRPDVQIHTTTSPVPANEIVQHEGFRATSLPRSIVDSARTHTDPEQIIAATREGIRRGLLTERRLRHAAKNAPKRVRDLIESAISEAS
jgi:predicted transcriptional regulator of viral defense system